MIQCTPVYVTKVQRNIGVMSVSLEPPTLIRQDYSAQTAAQKIQAAWRKHNEIPPMYQGEVHGAFDSWHGYYPNLCAIKIQAIVRGHQARVYLPMARMTKWILDNLAE